MNAKESYVKTVSRLTVLAGIISVISYLLNP